MSDVVKNGLGIVIVHRIEDYKNDCERNGKKIGNEIYNYMIAIDYRDSKIVNLKFNGQYIIGAQGIPGMFSFF
jgi:hypothetical protein